MRTAMIAGTLLLPVLLFSAGCGDDGGSLDEARHDNARQIAIDLEGSLQNAAFSPDSSEIVLTRFVRGYNREPADLFVASVAGGAARMLVTDGSANVNLPGSAWNAITGQIVFSSSRAPHDEIYAIAADGANGDEVRITDRPDFSAYEPSFSPDGEWIVFESHPLDVEHDGVITKIRAEGSGAAVALTAQGDDCRQPNWSPAGDKILYQRKEAGSWDIWVINADGTGAAKVTAGPGDKTDASFSPDGAWIVYSSDEGELDLANLFVIPTTGGQSIRVTEWAGYDGAPSWSPDGSRIAFESYPGDPDDCPGTTLWVIDAP